MTIGWLEEKDIEDLPVSAEAVSMTYREFRETVLSACRKDWQTSWSPHDGAPTFRMLRQRIDAFRHHVSYHAATWIRSGSYPATHIYRALGLDPRFTLELTRLDRWRRAAMRWVSPHTTLRLAVPWLSMARTYAGRAFIFEMRVPPPFLGSRDLYGRAVDFAIMRWRRFNSAEERTKFSGLRMDWIRSACKLGLNDAGAMIDWIPRPSSKHAGKLMWFLVRKGVILDVNEKQWMMPWYRERSHSGDGELDEARLARVIEVLLQHEVSREQVVKTLSSTPDHWLEPLALSTTLTLLRSHGVSQYGVLLDGLEYCMFDAKPDRWLFVLDTLGVRDPAMIVKFRPLLATSRPCSVKLASALIAQGADVAHIAECQELLLAAGAAATDHDPGAALALLMASPCNLSLHQVADASDYIRQSGDLAKFLGMLASHGFQDAATVLRFQPFYASINVETLSRLIALAKPLAETDVVEEVVDWITRCPSARDVDSYEYLAAALRIRTVSQLRQVAKAGFLSIGILRYLVEDRGLSSKNALLAWFYKRAFGIRSLQHWGTELKPIERVLLQDAFDRQAFNYWESNRSCIAHAVQQRVFAQLGRPPYRAPEAESEQYRKDSEAAYATERAALLPVLPRMLEATSGILLAGMVAHAWEGPEALDRQLAELAPLLDDLLAGHGPRAASLSDVEADAIALIYRSTPYSVRHLWSAVVDREKDIHDWNLAPSYPMKWRLASWTLQKPLDKAGFNVIGRAVKWASAFNSRTTLSAGDASMASTQANTEPEHELAELVAQLGILLAIANDDPGAAAWLRSVPILLTIDNERGYQHVLDMQAFFGIGLTDALQERLEPFCHTQSSQAVLTLLDHLGADPSGARDPRALLSAALQQAATAIPEKFASWATRELAKFGDDDVEGNTALLNAVVTKHPAAFFAKEAVKLCTAANVAMWQEARHAHLVVFDPVHKSLQGMALLYREILPDLDLSRPALVIRAINATGDAMATYYVSSIVDAILSTAVEIARASGCVAVGFPANTGMHLLSNLDPIAKDIAERYIGDAKRPPTVMPRGTRETWLRPATQVAASFDAYEHGVQPVGQLYLVWCDAT
jgi:hypothetical protein